MTVAGGAGVIDDEAGAFLITAAGASVTGAIEAGADIIGDTGVGVGVTRLTDAGVGVEAGAPNDGRGTLICGRDTLGRIGLATGISSSGVGATGRSISPIVQTIWIDSPVFTRSRSITGGR